MIDADAERPSLEQALRAACSFPTNAFGGEVTHGLGNGPQAEARRELLAFAADAPRNSGDPERSLIAVGDHVAQLCLHVSEFFGYQQWIVFDDRWAAAHPELAASLLRYNHDWDPCQ